MSLLSLDIGLIKRNLFLLTKYSISICHRSPYGCFSLEVENIVFNHLNLSPPPNSQTMAVWQFGITSIESIYDTLSDGYDSSHWRCSYPLCLQRFHWHSAAANYFIRCLPIANTLDCSILYTIRERVEFPIDWYHSHLSTTNIAWFRWCWLLWLLLLRNAHTAWYSPCRWFCVEIEMCFIDLSVLQLVEGVYWDRGDSI